MPKRDGRAKHVGVANFTTSLLEEAVKLASEPLVTNQIEVHPFIDQDKVLAACRTHGLAVTAHCPLARGKVAPERGHSPAETSRRAIGSN
jgi:2,5-diketo-D-gluconate reductase B